MTDIFDTEIVTCQAVPLSYTYPVTNISDQNGVNFGLTHGMKTRSTQEGQPAKDTTLTGKQSQV